MHNHWLTADKTLIIGHRGASAEAPENTMHAFLLAQQQGADGIEFDVRISADGALVIIHDETLERTTSGTGRVDALPLARLQELDAGGGERIATLDDLFENCGADFLYNIEIKEYGPVDRGVESAIAECVSRHGLESKVLVSSFDHDAMARAVRLMPDGVALAMLRSPKSPPIPSWFRGAAAHPHWSMVDETYMQWARENKIAVNVWTVDDLDVAVRLHQLGVNALMTNTPAALLRARDQW